jgi:putative ABC transport system permease protein
VLVIGETALTVVLLTGAGLLIKSFILLEQTGLGLNPHNVLMADLLLSKRYADAQRRDVYLGELLDSMSGLPGVEQAAVHTDPPFLGGGSQETFHVEGRADPTPRHGHTAAFNVVSNRFFRAMGIPMRRGRAFDGRDTAAGAAVAIVNETMARKLWPDGDALGKRIRLYYDRDPQHWLAVVGVAGDVRYWGRDREPVAQVFVPYQQEPYRSLPYRQAPFVSVVLRTAGDPASLVHAMQQRIWAVDPDQPVLHVQTMEQALAESLANRRAYSVLLGSFAAIALLMASAGIYGLISYAVARRTQEMGIRVALGATLGQIVALVLRQAMLLTLAGVTLGIGASLALTRLIAGLLYGVTATDGGTLTGVALLFAAVALAAAYVPARRAASIDPTAAFRYE